MYQLDHDYNWKDKAKLNLKFVTTNFKTIWTLIKINKKNNLKPEAGIYAID